jgi:nucleotide-binding universal stress UspA family protein
MKIRPNDPNAEERTPSNQDSSAELDLDSPRDTGVSVNLKQILVPIDFSGCSLRAMEYALALALPLGAKLTLLHVVEPAVYQQSYLGVTPPLEETNQNLVEAGRERLAALGRKRIGNRLRSDALVRIGRAHSEIPDTAKALSVDLIVMGTHGYTGLKHVLLGSTTERVVRHAPCPVLTVRLQGLTAAK